LREIPTAPARLRKHSFGLLIEQTNLFYQFGESYLLFFAQIRIPDICQYDGSGVVTFVPGFMQIGVVKRKYFAFLSTQFSNTG